MPQILRGVRHTGVVATLGPNGYQPYRATKDSVHHDCGATCSCRTRSVPSRPKAKRPGITNTSAKLTAKLHEIGRKAVTTSGSFARMSDSLDRLDAALTNARAAVDLRHAGFYRGRV